jgi:hypothetical protein
MCCYRCASTHSLSRHSLSLSLVAVYIFVCAGTAAVVRTVVRTGAVVRTVAVVPAMYCFAVSRSLVTLLALVAALLALVAALLALGPLNNS